MNDQEYKEFREWVDTDPIIPAGETRLSVWKAMKKGEDLNKWITKKK